MAWLIPDEIMNIVMEILETLQGPPWPEDITLRVAHAIENNPLWLALYNDSCLNHGIVASNQGIGRATRRITGLTSIARRRVNNCIIKSYTILR